MVSELRSQISLKRGALTLHIKVLTRYNYARKLNGFIAQGELPEQTERVLSLVHDID